MIDDFLDAVGGDEQEEHLAACSGHHHVQKGGEVNVRADYAGGVLLKNLADRNGLLVVRGLHETKEALPIAWRRKLRLVDKLGGEQRVDWPREAARIYDVRTQLVRLEVPPELLGRALCRKRAQNIADRAPCPQ